MPFAKGNRAPLTVASKIPKVIGCKKRDAKGPDVQGSDSASRGAPEKRKAFVDISNGSSSLIGGLQFRVASNELVWMSIPRKRSLKSTPPNKAHKVQISFPGRKKNCAKKQGKKTSVPGESEKSRAERQGSEAKEASETPDEGEGDESAPAGEAADCHVPPLFPKAQIPAEFDVDSEHHDDFLMCPEYAKEVFDYLKSREEKFALCDYMARQPNINSEMRAVLVDWLVEVQENFELYHETLYLAVKLTDHYLSRNAIRHETLQLVGATAMLLASKFEERDPPCMDNFVYICDDAYTQQQFRFMEERILRALSFDIGIPVPYSFLRRYAKCAGVGMDTLTLARYFCELSLMDVELALERASLLAAACLLLALCTKHLSGWSPILKFHSGYGITEVAPVVRKLYAVVAQPPNDKLKAVRSKYSHAVFFQVASLPLVDFDVLEKTLSAWTSARQSPQVPSGAYL